MDIFAFRDELIEQCDRYMQSFLDLVNTAWGMQLFACIGYEGPPFAFDREVPDPYAATPGATVSWRALLRAELDAYYARLYDLMRKQLRYVLDPRALTDRELADILDPGGGGAHRMRSLIAV